MAHARTIAARIWPGGPVQEARASLARAGSRFFNRREDVWTIADLAILHRGDLHLVQVTSENGRYARRKKLQAWATLHGEHVPSCATLWIWAWVKGKHMRRWRYSPVLESWTEIEPAKSRG